jgi:hypothetical protein
VQVDQPVLLKLAVVHGRRLGAIRVRTLLTAGGQRPQEHNQGRSGNPRRQAGKRFYNDRTNGPALSSA